MLTKFYRQIASFSAPTNFEKARLQATYKGDTEKPNSSSIQQIIVTLQGKDPETRPQIAFNTLCTKLQSSDSLVY